jgi:hypothetical protein
VYASIRQGKAKPGMAEELTRRIKERAIPIISDVEGFMGYYVVYATDDTVTAISIFKDFGCRRKFGWDLRSAISGDVKLSDYAARSIG